MAFGIDVLKNNLTNPARAYLFDVIFPIPMGGGDAETLMLRCQAASIPTVGVGEIKVPYKQTAGTKYHGKVTMDQTWALTFIEGEDKAIFQEFYNWIKKVVDPKSGIGTPDPDVKTDVILSLRTTADQEYLKLKLRGAWVEKIGPVDLAMDTETPIRLPVTLAYDYWEQLT